MKVYIDFLTELLFRQKELSFYFDEIKTSFSKTTIFKNNTPDNIVYKNEVSIFYDFPSYITPLFSVKIKKHKALKINTYKGYLIQISKYTNVDEYLLNKFSSGRRQKLKTYKKRLETCFNITYKTYHGPMDKEEYKAILNTLYNMLQKRFDVLGEDNFNLKIWDLYIKDGYSLITEKKACLFVIYDNDTPISISFNPIMGNILFGFVRSYDMDYSKFYLGFTDFIKQLEWCFNHNIEIFDLLKGSFPYKNRIVDTSYFFQRHILFNTSNLHCSLVGYFSFLKTKVYYSFIKTLKLLKIDDAYHYVLSKRQLKKRNQKNQVKFTYQDLPKNYISSDKMSLISSINNKEFDFLKRAVYQFLYSSVAPINSVEIYQNLNNPNQFILQGVKSSRKVTFSNEIDPHKSVSE